MHRLADELTQWQTFIRSWFCNSGANRHEIWVRFRKRLKFEVWKISSESAKFRCMKITMIQTWFKKSYTHRRSTPEDKGLIQKVNIFCMGNGHVHAFNTPTKNRANWMRASYLFLRLKKIGHYFCRRVYSGVHNSQMRLTINAVEKIPGFRLFVVIDIVKNRCSTIRFFYNWYVLLFGTRE